MCPSAPVPPVILYACLHGNCWLLKSSKHRHKHLTQTRTGCAWMQTHVDFIRWQVLCIVGKMENIIFQ